MSVWKKWMRAVSEPTVSTQDNRLALTHLRKLFADFRHPTAKSTQKDQENRLYSMLPIFCKVFDNSPASEMTEKFADILQFCSHVSKLMVTEIRRRASNQSTEAASCAIVRFLEAETVEENGNGWMLLGTLNLLSMGSQALIDCMTAASLPSTLVKCLYLFFDLPELEGGDVLEPGTEFTPKERRILLQKIFVQVLVRLCSHVSPAEELARKDDLILLFSAITSWCPAQNVMWRKSAAEVLVTLSRYGLTQTVVKYIHEKGCVRHCIENMQRIQELSPIELVEMFVSVFCFLKDSSEVSQVLLEDFRQAQGYIYLSEFLLRLELNQEENAKQALRNLVLLIGSLTTCGFQELRPTQASTGSLFTMPGFSLPQPTGKDLYINTSPSSSVSVRNIQAFQVLQTGFLKGTKSHLCGTVLDVISSIYHQDSSNYFILETQHTLSQFAEKIYLKPLDIQDKFFELMEFIVFDLNFVPCKELISLSILIKSLHSLACSILCMKSLLKILRSYSMYKDVFREVGLLEVIVTCLHRYAALLKEPHEDESKEEEKVMDSQQIELGNLVMEALSVLLSGNNSNAGVFRECGGARCAHNMVPYTGCRQPALNIVQQLVLSPGGDDDMGTLLGLMHTAPVLSLELKTHILKSLLNVLRESHRTRTVFRKVGGFVYVMSVLVSMEGCLEDPPKAPWDTVKRQDVLNMLRTVFSTLTVAMRYEPANAKFFATEVRYDSLTEAVRLLGSFSTTIDIQPTNDSMEDGKSSEVLEDFFSNAKENRLKQEVPQVLLSACLMIRYLYDMALDTFDKPPVIVGQQKCDSPSLKRFTVVDMPSPQSSPKPKRASTGSISLPLAPQPDRVIVHPGAVMSIFHLLPAVEYHESMQMAQELQLYVAEKVKSMLRTEKNQQIMCDAGFPHELLCHGSVALADESHPLHVPLQHTFERLASQSLTPRDLRDFLRLNCPLNCQSVDEICHCDCSLTDNPWRETASLEEKKTTLEVDKKLNLSGGTIPLTRVKCLVSMTTPRDARMHGLTTTPAFVEFDLCSEGFGCLYLPSIAPQGPPTPSVVSGVVGASDPVVIGGIGTEDNTEKRSMIIAANSGERVFPPQSGMTYSTWFCVEKFSNVSTDAHPVRLLTIVRNLQGRDENLICLSVMLASKDRSLIVSTQETYTPVSVSGNEQSLEQEPKLNDNTVRFWCPELTQEGQWHHLVLLFHRAGIMKNSSVSLFVDGEHINTQKLHYISPNLGGGGTASPTAFTSVFAYIGSPPCLRRQSRLSWRQGPCHLLEDIISSTTVKNIYNLGPTYVGSFQSPMLDDQESCNAFITEEKVVFGVYAHTMSQMTIAKIRKVYNKVDSKSIAKQIFDDYGMELAMSNHENATPIRILHNAAGHLNGPARTLGAILMGYIGVRTFCPKPVSKMLQNVGGTAPLLGLIAMATDVEGLYAAVKALVCVVKSNKSAMWDMDRIRGYQTLAMLYKKKQNLLNSHILHLTFSLVGTVDSGRECSIIPNKMAFEDLLCDLEVWHEAPCDLQKSLYEHFYELLTDSSDQNANFILMREVGLVQKLLHILKDPKLTPVTICGISNVLTVLLQGPPHPTSLLRFGQFVASTLPAANQSEKDVVLSNPSPDQADDAYRIRLRNVCMDIILRLLVQPNGTSLNTQKCEELEKSLGYDWLLLFLQCHIHSSTITLILKILITVFQSPVFTQHFREGVTGGGWLSDTKPVLGQQVGVMLGFNIGASMKGVKREINKEVTQVPGFTVLHWLLPKHNNVAEVYFLLMALLLGQPVRDVSTDIQFNLDAIWTVIFGVPTSKPVSVMARDSQLDLCAEAALVILSMIRSILNQDCESCGESWAQEYPVTLMQFLLFLYHNQEDFNSFCVTQEFISALVACLFPYKPLDSDSIVTTPTEEYKPFPESDSILVIKTPEKNSAVFLTGHPARKYVIDFLRTIVFDSFSQPSVSKAATVIDMILEGFPDHASRVQHREYHTEMMKTIMDHLLASDVLLGDQAALQLASGCSYSNMANNVFYFAGRVVDKLWQGVFTRESKEVFEFTSKLISQAKRKASGISLDQIYKTLNRTILFQLSRPVGQVMGQAAVLDALHKLTSHRSLVFGPGNFDQEFLGCLCFCLLQLTDDPAKSAEILNETKAQVTTWHIDLSVDHNLDLTQSLPKNCTASKEGLKLVSNAANRVWEELFVCKKTVLEEIFRTQLNNMDLQNSSSKVSPNLNSVRHLIQESASKIWVTYAENERRCSYMHSDKLQAQIQSKLQKVGSGVLRLTSRRTKRELPIKSSPLSNVHVSDFVMWTLSHIAIVKDLVELQYRQYLQSNQHMTKYLMEEWTQTEKELLRERGVWGPQTGYHLNKWILDMTEGPCRMRKKLYRNDMFYINYPYRPDMDNSPLKYKVAISEDSKEYYEHYRSQTLMGEDNLPIVTGTDTIFANGTEPDERSQEDEMNMPKLLPRKDGVRSGDADDDQEDSNIDGGQEGDKPDGTGENTADLQGDNQMEGTTDKADNQTILRLLGDGEKITHMFRCGRIQGLDTAEGLLLFGREHFYMVDGFTLLKSKEIKDIDSLPQELHDPIIPKASISGSTQKRIFSKFAYDDIREVHKCRYLLQHIAIEIFFSDGRNYLLAFPRKVRNKVYAKFQSVATAITDNAQQSVSGQKQNVKVEASSGLISSLIGEKSVTQRWERGEINNFQYLMHLNTLAGRSYNDLMQYPVFPWILADYDSEELDLNSSSTFRDLTKPMGAQTPDRLQQFKKRYNDWDDPQGETPPYHYGTHYSSAMIVASYLLRMEPFTQHFLKLQGGHFDLADRMFHSVKENWLSASKNNMADVKELIPEFFYLPEFLLNSNNFDLGCKQSGVVLGDVVLPLWARGDPREFIRVHREALECEYVSAHLHEWIDLIFGYKQQGAVAVDAVNVFHHLFYEGNVDIYSIDDPLKKNATIGFINNFGQIPKQLFKKLHPQKKLNIRMLDPIPMGSYSSVVADKLFFHNVDNLRPSMQPVKELKTAVGQIIHNDKVVLAVEQNKVLIPHMYSKYLAWGFADLSVRIGNYEADKASSVFECLDNGEILCAACPNPKIFITGGIGCVVNVWEQRPKDKRVILKQPLYGHTEPVTCLVASPAHNIIVSGSRDRTCIVWDMSQLLFVKQLRGHMAPVAAICINELTGDIATCAGTFLHVWSINGDEVACVNTATSRNQQILCVTMSQLLEWDNRNVILTGSSDGVVRMWSVEYVQVPDDVKARQKETLLTISSAKEDSISALMNSDNLDGSQPISIPVRRGRRESCDSYSDPKSAADRLKEFKDPETLTAVEMELGSSAESDGHISTHMKSNREGTRNGVSERMYERAESTISTESNFSDFIKQNNVYDDDNSARIHSLDNASVLDQNLVTDEGGNIISEEGAIDKAVDALVELGEANISGTQLPSQSDPCIVLSTEDVFRSDDRSQSHPDLKSAQPETDDADKDFVLIEENQVKEVPKTVEDLVNKYRPKTKNCLREGFKWQRQLMFRSKLTMHTAFERKDNKDPAAVTAVAISRDHKTVYVGDAKGRIFSWTVTDQPGRVVADHWMKDDGADNCVACHVKFSFSERRHHCRNCGKVFCSRCSRFEMEIRRLRILKPVRVCQSCYNILRTQFAMQSASKR